MLAGVACAALMVLSAPVAAQTIPELPLGSVAQYSANPAVRNFYVARGGAPLWLKAGVDSPAARELIGVLERAQLDGMANGPAAAAEAQAMLARAQSGDPTAIAGADRILSNAWVQYVQALENPPTGMTYADAWVAPRHQSDATILAQAAAAHKRSTETIATVNDRGGRATESKALVRQTSGTEPRTRSCLWFRIRGRKP